MKQIICFVLLLFMNFYSEAQSKYEFRFKIIESSNLSVKVDTINKEVFNNFHKENPLPDYFIKDSDSLLKALVSENINILKLKDTCLVFITKEEEEQLCKYIPDPYSKNQTDFKLIGHKKEYLIFEKSGYEWWEYFCFNLKTQQGFYTMNLPIFNSDVEIFSYGNYYLEGQFEILDIENEKYYGFDCYNWELTDLYKIEETFYLKFKSNDKVHEEKFIKIEVLD